MVQMTLMCVSKASLGAIVSTRVLHSRTPLTKLQRRPTVSMYNKVQEYSRLHLFIPRAMGRASLEIEIYTRRRAQLCVHLYCLDILTLVLIGQALNFCARARNKAFIV